MITTSVNSLRTLGCVSSDPLDLHSSSSGGHELIFTYSDLYFTPPVLILLSVVLRCAGREAPLKTEAKKLLGTSAFSSVATSSSGAAYTFFDFFFLANILLADLPVIFLFLADFSYSFTLAFLIPSLHNQTSSLHSSKVTCCYLYHLCMCFFPCSLTSTFQLSHADPLPLLPYFLLLGIAN